MFVRQISTQAERKLFAGMVRRGRTEQGVTQERLFFFGGRSLRWSNDTGQGKCDPNQRDSVHLAAITKVNPIIFAEEVGRYVSISTR